MTARCCFWKELLPPEILNRLAPAGECVEWAGPRERGYGRVGRSHTGTAMAHRAVYILVFGDPGPDLQVDHLCHNRACVKPDHLEAVTARINNVRRSQRKTHCIQGHPLAGDNVRVHTRATGQSQRVCVTCARANARAAYYRRKAAN